MSLLLEKFLIQNNHTNFSRKDIALQMQTHPQNPSFRAITDTLDYFGIDNVAATVPEGSLESMPNNFLTIIENSNPQLVMVVKKEKFVYLYSEDQKRVKYSYADFNEIWSRTIIAIEEISRSDSRSLLSRVVFPLILLGILIAFLIVKQVSWTSVYCALLSTIGLYLSFLLVKEKIGYHSAIVHSICTSISSTNCDTVINSKGAMLTKNISLADAGFLYFSVLIFQSIFFGFNTITWLVILVSIPIILYSIYYQAFELRQWCPLCLGIAFIVILLYGVMFWDVSNDILASHIIEFLMTAALLTPAYFFVKNLFVQQKEDEEKIVRAQHFKRNPDLLRSFMKEARVIDDLGIVDNEIRLVNQNAEYTMIVFTNPFCGFCKAAFESYAKIIKAHPNIEIWVRFNTDLKNMESTSTQITVRLVELYFEKGQEYFISAYLEWFDDKSEKHWFKKYGKPNYDPKVVSLLKVQLNWAIKNEIAHTPTTLIDGLEFPSVYGYEDLPLVISDILELQDIR